VSSLLTLAIPCRADEPGLAATVQTLLAACQHPQMPAELCIEMVVCINGVKREHPCPPLTAVRTCCAEQGIEITEVWEGQERKQGCRERTTVPGRREEELPLQSLSPSKPPVQHCTMLLTEQLGKPHAWNMLWQQTAGELLVFCDADVRVDTAAVFSLLKRLQEEPDLRLIAAREVPVLQAGATVWSRMGAIPYRFNFGNVGGRLYLLKKHALTGEMPEDLLLEDAWLTVAVGKRWVAKEWRAEVRFLPPATWRDYFAERVRSEGGKLQIRRVHAALLSDGPIAQYHWSQLWQGIALREYPLVFFALGVRLIARIAAWLSLTRKDFYALYRPFASTKGWASVK
jgi:cellulose synthase/poly-beta-1,6-N-acetylglucosamine synthase-like glycosyltransferase